ncbi:MAG: substrate-binding domain-containing protein, partial [Alphaproteobacteria bacterium]
MTRRAILAGLGSAAFGARMVHGAAPVLVFAAASLQTSLTAVAAAYQRETGRPVTFSFAASSTLARQI